ncbi:MAG: hypothetical protein HYU66_10625 [Armatimonadetes bacterium]|nr:hypothetical protein [Armatimonadota bacterium]
MPTVIGRDGPQERLPLGKRSVPDWLAIPVLILVAVLAGIPLAREMRGEARAGASIDAKNRQYNDKLDAAVSAGRLTPAEAAADTAPVFNDTPAAPSARMASYRVSGMGSATVIYANAGGGTESHTVSLPWTGPSIPLDNRPMLQLYVQAQSAGARLTCEIVVDGHVWRTASSDGDYCVATVGGWWGMER